MDNRTKEQKRYQITDTEINLSGADYKHIQIDANMLYLLSLLIL
jgi:hypothetical protein